MDLTGDSVTEDALVQGYTAHDAAGNAVDGANPYEKAATDAEVLTQEQLLDEIVEELAKRCVVTEPLLQARTVTPTEEVQVVTPDAGYDGLSSVVVEAAPSAVLQAKTVTPSKVQQVVTPDSGYDGLSSVTVEATQGGEGAYGWKKYVSRLPSGYTEVEYIQNSGTQYIDTLYHPKNTTTAEVDFELLGATSADECILACDDGWMVNNFSLFKSGVAFGSTYKAFSSYLSGRFSAKIDKGVFWLNGVQQFTLSASAFTTKVTLPLFTQNRQGTISDFATGRLYSCKIYDNGTLVRDFVPCKNASNVVGLYDLVNSVFYANAGSGAFTAGSTVNDPSVMNMVGYVVSDDADAYPDGALLDGYYYEKL